MSTPDTEEDDQMMGTQRDSAALELAPINGHCNGRGSPLLCQGWHERVCDRCPNRPAHLRRPDQPREF